MEVADHDQRAIITWRNPRFHKDLLWSLTYPGTKLCQGNATPSREQLVTVSCVQNYQPTSTYDCLLLRSKSLASRFGGPG
jgi:hypothetical protein